MSVDDYGIEVLKKAAIEITPGNKAEYVIRTGFFDESGAQFSRDNPLPVAVVRTEGEPVTDEDTEVDLGSTLSHNHDYTVPANFVFDFRGVLGSGSGDTKQVTQIALDGSTFVTVATRFNFRAPGLDYVFPDSLVRSVPAGGKVRVIRTNLETKPSAAFDVTSTILGELHPV